MSRNYIIENLFEYEFNDIHFMTYISYFIDEISGQSFC
jgi:hypothetical protein